LIWSAARSRIIGSTPPSVQAGWERCTATDTNLGRAVALKVLPPNVASDPERLARFQREARAVAALNHPNVVTLYSVEECDGVHSLTMELIEGGSLDGLISRISKETHLRAARTFIFDAVKVIITCNCGGRFGPRYGMPSLRDRKLKYCVPVWKMSHVPARN
jgi:serine/threonine protein kinase